MFFSKRLFIETNVFLGGQRRKNLILLLVAWVRVQVNLVHRSVLNKNRIGLVIVVST
jgi:hypothetical protein